MTKWINSSGKNVASDIAVKLCDSVAAKLEGKVLGTFTSKYMYRNSHNKFCEFEIYGVKCNKIVKYRFRLHSQFRI